MFIAIVFSPITAALERLQLAHLYLGILAALAPALVSADYTLLLPGEGYVLIRFEVSRQQKIGTFAIRNVDTREEVRFRLDDFRSAGASAWMAVVVVPEGRYFWSEYEATYGNTAVESRNLGEMYRRRNPTSADDSFEVVADVVNYVGDWTMRVVSSEPRRLDPAIRYEKATLERYLEQYPELVNVHPIYLSMMGKAAISFAELAKIMQSQPE